MVFYRAHVSRSPDHEVALDKAVLTAAHTSRG
jgi:hypothetical protein